MTEPYGLIYAAISPSGKVYVGQTTTSITQRWNEHCRHDGAPYLHSAIKKYGKDNFILQEVCYAFDKESLDFCEQRCIAQFNSNDPACGYNLQEGGSTGKHSEETKAKISASKMGHSVSEEARRKIGLAGKGRTSYWKGKKFSEEYCKKLSEAHKDQTGYWTGKKFSEEHRRHLSESHKRNLL